MSRLLKLILAINVLVLVVLTFAYPHLMVGPGKLIAGHQSINADCFACHTTLTGVQSTKCVVCHKATDIGRLTTTGAPVVKPLTNTPFHQELISQDCVACHSDHAGVKRYQVQDRVRQAAPASALARTPEIDVSATSARLATRPPSTRCTGKYRAIAGNAIHRTSGPPPRLSTTNILCWTATTRQPV